MSEFPMCGRYYLDSLPETLMEHFSITGVPRLEARYNIAPTQSAPIVRQSDDGRECVLARWGLVPFWAKGTSMGSRMINARAETVAGKPAFRAAWKRRRCLVPASGFYEWQRVADGPKQPWALHPQDTGELLALGGLWERWEPGEGEALTSFSILTTEANERVAPVHDRMPVLIPPDAFDHWLAADDPRQLVDLLQPAGLDALSLHPISREVNRPANDHAGLLDPIETGAAP